MKDGRIYITENDMARLLEEFFQNKPGSTEDNQSYFDRLQEKLLSAEVVESGDVPEDTITMNSVVCLKDLKSGKRHVYRLVYLSNEDTTGQTISVLTPVGMAMLGHREGDIIDCVILNGIERFLIQELIFQPERLGNYEI